MRGQEWYKTLAESASTVKFVIFIHQPTYKQVCPPKPKKKKKTSGYVKGTIVEGSKFTDEAMGLCQELGIPALCFKASSAEELFAGMLTTDAEGTVWQNEAVCRSYTENGQDFTENGQLALWEDSFHSTPSGAEVHFRCLVKALKARCVEGGFDVTTSAKPPSNTNSAAMQAAMQAAAAMQAQWTNQAAFAQGQQVRSQPY